jgi:hypothetical protein
MVRHLHPPHTIREHSALIPLDGLHFEWVFFNLKLRLFHKTLFVEYASNKNTFVGTNACFVLNKWLLFTTKWTNHGDNNLYFEEIMRMSTLYLNNMLVACNSSLRVDKLLHLETYFRNFELISFRPYSEIVCPNRKNKKYQLYCLWIRGRRDRMTVGFMTTYVMSVYHHWSCQLESRDMYSIQHYVIKFASDRRQVGGFLRALRFPPPIKLTSMI